MKLVWQIVLMICVVVPLTGVLFLSEKYQSQGVPHTASASLSTSPITNIPTVPSDYGIYAQTAPLSTPSTFMPTQSPLLCSQYHSSQCPPAYCAVGKGKICMTIEEADESYVEPTVKPQIPYYHKIETRAKENNRFESVISELNMMLTHPADWQIESLSWSGIPTARTTLKSPRNFILTIQTGIFGVGGGCIPPDESEVDGDMTTILGQRFFTRLVSTDIDLEGGQGYISEKYPNVLSASVLRSKTGCLNLAFIEVPGLGSDMYFNKKDYPNIKEETRRGLVSIRMGYFDPARTTADAGVQWLPKDVNSFRSEDYRIAIEEILPSMRLVQ